MRTLIHAALGQNFLSLVMSLSLLFTVGILKNATIRVLDLFSWSPILLQLESYATTVGVLYYGSWSPILVQLEFCTSTVGALYCCSWSPILLQLEPYSTAVGALYCCSRSPILLQLQPYTAIATAVKTTIFARHGLLAIQKSQPERTPLTMLLITQEADCIAKNRILIEKNNLF